jgi:hypothetical protein
MYHFDAEAGASPFRKQIYLWLPSEKYKIISWKKTEFEDLKNLLVSFILDSVIVKDNASTMWYWFKKQQM